jgi:hypothetical protein
MIILILLALAAYAVALYYSKTVRTRTALVLEQVGEGIIHLANKLDEYAN